MNIRMIVLASLLLNMPFSALAEVTPQKSDNSPVAEVPLKSTESASILTKKNVEKSTTAHKSIRSYLQKKDISSLINFMLSAFASAGGISNLSSWEKDNYILGLIVSSGIVGVGKLASDLLENNTSSTLPNALSLMVATFTSSSSIIKKRYPKHPYLCLVATSALIGTGKWAVEKLKSSKKNKTKKEIQPNSLN